MQAKAKARCMVKDGEQAEHHYSLVERKCYNENDGQEFALSFIILCSEA